MSTQVRLAVRLKKKIDLVRLLERSNSRVISELLFGDPLKPSKMSEDDQRVYQDSMVAVSQARKQLLATSGDNSGERKNRMQALDEREIAHEALKASFRTKYAATRRRDLGGVIDEPSALKLAVLDDRTAIIGWIDLQQPTAFIIRKEGIQWVLQDRGIEPPRVRMSAASLQDAQASVSMEGLHELYVKTFLPIEPYLKGVTRLIVVYDTGSIPVEALLGKDPRVHGRTPHGW